MKNNKRKSEKKNFIIDDSIVYVLSTSFILYLYINPEYIKYVVFSLAIVIGLALFLIYKISIRRKREKLNYTMRKIDNMTGEEFEDYLKTHFECMGYKVETTPRSGDYGADLIVSKLGQRIVIQAKRYKNKVGLGAVQEVVGAMGYYKANGAMVITNSYYTKNAVNLAESNGVVLWDRDDLTTLHT